MNFWTENIEIVKSISDKAERLRFLLFLLLVFSLPFDRFYSSALFLAFSFSTLLAISKQRLKQIPRQVWLFQLIYLLSLTGYYLSLHRSLAGFMLEKQATIFFIPLLLPVALRPDRDKITVLVNVLTLASFTAIVFLFIRLFMLIEGMRLPLVSTALSGVFFNHEFSRPLDIHAGYLSLYVAFSVFNVVNQFNRIKTFSARLILIVTGAVLFAGLFFLASRNTMIATLAVMLFIFPLFRIRNKRAYLAITLLSLGACFSIIRSVPYLWERFSRQLVSELKPVKNGEMLNYYTLEPRIERWKCATALVKRSPWVGYGTGDEVAMLKTQYAKRGLFISYLEEFNSHNQYLSILVKHGIAGLLIFIGAFVYYLRLAFKQRHFMYISFLLLLVIGFYTENILDSNKGILFFSIFNTFMGYAILNQVAENSRQERADEGEAS